jgi:hypothetical protein
LPPSPGFDVAKQMQVVAQRPTSLALQALLTMG